MYTFQKKIAMALVALVASMSHLPAATAGESGGGGAIDRMRGAIALSRAQLIELLRDNGRLLKAEVLEPFFVGVNLEDVTDPDDETQADLRAKFGWLYSPSKGRFLRDLPYMPFAIENCSCLPHEDACRMTDSHNNPYSCFNIDRLANRSTSLSELAGLAAHEISRIRIPQGSPDQDDNHILAAYVEKIVQSGVYGGRGQAPKTPVEFATACSKYVHNPSEIRACRRIQNQYAWLCMMGNLGNTYASVIEACAVIDTNEEGACAATDGKAFPSEIAACNFNNSPLPSELK